MRRKELFSTLAGCFDRGSCYNHVSRIYETDRWFDFVHFRETASYCAEQMQLGGLEEVDLLALRADGRTAYGDWIIPKAWEVKGATLKILQPFAGNNILADYSNVPCSLMMYSAPTPAGGVEAEVMVVEQAEGMIPESVRGKFIFTGGRPQEVVKLAVENGAVGIISDFLPLYPGVRDDRQVVYDAFRWENDFMCPVNDTGLFGFSLSPRNGDLLRSIISGAQERGGKVILHAEVDSCFYEGTCYTVSGVIRGTDTQRSEVMICGHLYEPGANDNASGCGIILELAAALQKAIDSRKLARPFCSIRFVMGYECAGLMGYCMKYPERIARTKSALNVDMAGSAKADKAELHLWHNPLSNWSYIDDLLPELADEYRKYSGEKFGWLESPFSIVDNLLADPMIGVPTVSMIMHPSRSYHSSLDKMDLVDPDILNRSGMIAGAFLYSSAMCEKTGKISALAGVGKLAGSFLEECSRTIDKNLLEIAKTVIPVRKIPGALTFQSLGKEIREGLKWKPFYNYEVNCPLFWTDGKRSLLEIASASAAELKKDNPGDYLVELLEFFSFLECLEYIGFTGRQL